MCITQTLYFAKAAADSFELATDNGRSLELSYYAINKLCQ